MEKIKILQMGLGPLGVKINQYIHDKKTIETISAVDINPMLIGKDLGEVCGREVEHTQIKSSISEVQNLDEVDVVVLTTTSSFSNISDQVIEIIRNGKSVVSTCEELTFPWTNDQALSNKIDRIAKENNVAVVSTGVNPGFLMDTLPSMLTGVCKEVEYIQVNRIQDATTRRVPFQKKIGAGLTMEEFEQKKQDGSLRHVGLTESMQFIAHSIGWSIDQTEDIISPVIATDTIQTNSMVIDKGMAMGVRQVARAMSNGEEKIKLVFEAAVGSGTSFDEIQIKGEPNIHSKIEGGVHGDVATCSIVINAIPNIIKASPGLKTMADISLVSYIN